MGQDQSFTGYTALFGILENEKDLLNVESFSISSPTLEDIFLAIIFEADSDPDNIIKKRKRAKDQISPEKDEEEQSYADLSTDGQSTSSFRISTPRPNMVPVRPSGLSLCGNQATSVSFQNNSSFERFHCHIFCCYTICLLLLPLKVLSCQILALLWKRFLNLRRDRKLLLSSLVRIEKLFDPPLSDFIHLYQY